MHERGGVLDVHLMVERPERRVEEFAAAGADSISVHWEATPHVHYALKAVREAGLDAGLAINPATPPEAIVGLVEAFDHVLCMTVNPGWGGQEYIDTSTAKVARLRELLGPACRSRWTAASTRPPPAPPRRPERPCSSRARRSTALPTPRRPTARSPPRPGRV